MGDLMRPVSFSELVKRIFDEYKKDGSIFGIHKDQFFKKTKNSTLSIFGENCETPLGPAAGPHTQLTQNIIASYLTGGRFFELKTVQILDTLEVPKPCIDAEDECFNTEWSSEFTLTKAYDEYLKAWFILYLMEELFDLNNSKERSFIYNMSVGYDLAGIKNERVQTFINDMMDSSSNTKFTAYAKELQSIIEAESFLKGTDLEDKVASIKDVPGKVPAQLCNQLTLSTMHGCPPKEIEDICMYMLTEKKLNTFVKLNPTLLGFDGVRDILDSLGFDYIGLSKEAFSHDLQYSDAEGMLERLIATSKKENLQFGVKLTNTLGSVNNKGVLPGDEMYMSGRALFPLSINLAAKISRKFKGELPISYSGGASKFNVEDIFATGIRPITLATDLLQPGGYNRLKDMTELLEKSSAWEMNKIDVDKLDVLAADALKMSYTEKDWRGKDKASVDEDLPIFDCYVAPCIVACPISQDIPEYIKLVGQKRYTEAVELIYEKNALPSITGHICSHQCQYSCTRLDYEGTVEIREIKKLAILNGFEDYKKNWKMPEINKGKKIAVVGAGPAGLSAAYFLSREGFDVTIFDKHDSAGGVVDHVIPQFRITREAILSDINFIEAHGVKFVFGVDPKFSIKDLKTEGFDHVCLAIGAEGVRTFPIDGDNTNIIPSFDFLQSFNKDPNAIKLGKHVVVVGAGDTAMDAVRSAKRVPGVESVRVVYRRAQDQMPASQEEYEDALEDGIPFQWLRNPEKFDADGTLTLRVMELGEPDESGRRRPVPTDKTETIHVDTLIPSIGEVVDADLLKDAGVEPNSRGWFDTDDNLRLKEDGVYLIGDGRTGPSTIVQCIQEGRQAADAICKNNDSGWSRNASYSFLKDLNSKSELLGKRGTLQDPLNRKVDYDQIEYAEKEAARCLECNFICNKCVDVCPNRANLALEFAGFRDEYQIIHIDAYCNECGNCGTFCPYNGLPYKDKFTVYNLPGDFENSENNGFYVDGSAVKLRLAEKLYDLTINNDGVLSGDEPAHADYPEVKKVVQTIYNDYGYLLGPVED
jgi:putative selenate reductase